MIDDATKEIIYRDFVDISIAVATPRGLVVPVLRNCETMNYRQIEMEMNELATKVKTRFIISLSFVYKNDQVLRPTGVQGYWK